MPDSLRTVVFVDGQNFGKNLQAFEFRTGPERPFRLDEKHFSWQSFFADVTQWFQSRTGVNHRLVRAYWYNAESMTPFEEYPRAITSALAECRKECPDLNRDQLVELARGWHAKQHSWFYGSRRQMYEGIQRRAEFLEFKFVGQFRVEPFTVRRVARATDGTYDYQGTQIGEKGVDVGIATDMIAKMAHYDVAILVSGDADFIPVVRYLKDNLRQVYQFSIAKGIPPQITYLSPWLKGVVDVFGHFDELELLGTYLDPKASIPPAIRAEIGKRLAELRAVTLAAAPPASPSPGS